MNTGVSVWEWDLVGDVAPSATDLFVLTFSVCSVVVECDYFVIRCFMETHFGSLLQEKQLD